MHQPAKGSGGQNLILRASVLLGVIFALLAVAHQQYSPPAFVALVLVTTAGWYFEVSSVEREYNTFSCGFVFYLATMLAGAPVVAFLQALGALALRWIVGRRHHTDLISTTLVCALASLASPAQATLSADGALFVKLLLLGLQALSFYLLSGWKSKRLQLWKTPALAWEERELARLRLKFCLPAALGLWLLPQQLWMLGLLLPAFSVALASTENLTYRFHHRETMKEKAEAESVRSRLKSTESHLALTTQKHEVLESLSETFSSVLDPVEAFEELSRVTRDIVDYRSLVLLHHTDQGFFEPALQDSPQPDLAARSRLLNVTVPQMAKTWKEERPIIGSLGPEPEVQLVEGERQFVVFPVKPLGVLYIGREGEQRFSKGEAGRLWYIIRRAHPALHRAAVEADTKRQLHTQARRTEQLAQKVTLSSRLLEGMPMLLSSVTDQQACRSLQTLLEQTVWPSGGLVILKGREQPALEWGGQIDDRQTLQAFLNYLGVQARTVYLTDLRSSPYSKLAPKAGALVAAPLALQGGESGVLLVLFAHGDALNAEERDFISTCAYLLSLIFDSHRLAAEVDASQKQIVQASKLSAIGQLAAGVAHELNSPLAAIGLAIEAAQIRPENAAGKLERAANALERAKKIVADLLDYSRHAGEERVLVDPEEVVKGAVQLAEATLAKQQVELVVVLEHGRMRVLGSVTDFQQIVINLILNAVQAGPDSKRVVISTAVENSMVLMRVQDFGSGIPSALGERIFEPFFTTKPAGEGTGLGLSVCRQLAKRHAGELSYRSQEGEGTVFTLALPARQGT